ncbi:MAG: zinc ABC transporter substrate-binding protein [Actinomycetales bacterium]|nr:MAG: zinc ABC transporter substrate-binding protein [Actinomycetales bacterium]
MTSRAPAVSRSPRRRWPGPVTACLTLIVALALGGCGQPGAGTEAAPPADDGRLQVAASFYPIEYAVSQVGGPHVQVTTLTKAGAEPHSLELTPKDVETISSMDLVVYSAGFQAAVDRAVEQVTPESALDVSPAAQLDLDAAAHDHDGDLDPHFWLDPTKYAAIGPAIADRLADLDPQHADEYQRHAAAFTDSMTDLDAEFAAGLRTCESRTLVTSHAAFGYLAARYDLTQVPIAGLSPDQEPSARELADIAATVKAEGVRSIYAEILVDTDFARTIAESTGTSVATLDPVAGITNKSKGSDYLEVMRANLATLQVGQGCS